MIKPLSAECDPTDIRLPKKKGRDEDDNAGAMNANSRSLATVPLCCSPIASCSSANKSRGDGSEYLNHLLRLATARNIKKFITRLAWGQNDPDNPVIPSRLRTTQQRQPNQHHPDRKATRFQEADEGAGRSSSRRRDLEQSSPLHEPLPSFHLSLRVPNNNDGLEMLNADGTNALTPIHRDWERIQRISELVRRGQLPGITGSMIRDVVVVGRGVSIMALRFVYLALCKDQTANV